MGKFYPTEVPRPSIWPHPTMNPYWRQGLQNLGRRHGHYIKTGRMSSLVNPPNSVVQLANQGGKKRRFYSAQAARNWAKSRTTPQKVAKRASGSSRGPRRAGTEYRKAMRQSKINRFKELYWGKKFVKKFRIFKRNKRQGQLAVGRHKYAVGSFTTQTYNKPWIRPKQKQFNRVDWGVLKTAVNYRRTDKKGVEVIGNVGEQGTFGTTLLTAARVAYILGQSTLTDGMLSSPTPDYSEGMIRLYMQNSRTDYRISNGCSVPVRVRITVYDCIRGTNVDPTAFYTIDRNNYGYSDATVADPDGGVDTGPSTWTLQTMPGAYPFTTGSAKKFWRIRNQKDIRLNIGNSTSVTIFSQLHKKIWNPVDFYDQPMSGGTSTITYLGGVSTYVLVSVWSTTVGSTATGVTVAGVNTENTSMANIAMKYITKNDWCIMDTLKNRINAVKYDDTITGSAFNATMNVVEDNNVQGNIVKGT